MLSLCEIPPNSTSTTTGVAAVEGVQEGESEESPPDATAIPSGNGKPFPVGDPFM